MKKMILLAGICICLFSSCKSKKSEEKKESFLSAISIIKGEVAHVDTSFYQITKATLKDSIYTDTEYIKREDFKALAKDFLDIPDVADKKNMDDYKEEKLFDNSMNRVIITYRPVNPETSILQKQEFVIVPDMTGGESKIKSIILDMQATNKDSSVRKIMLWQVGSGFQVTRIVQKNAQPESTTTFKVTWNEENDF